ncbi:MAG: TRAP transporter large permease [Burkholderiaceae bacterium]|nr:TRAP transporter large permease [Burkholderiaceae bacterium]
MTTLIIIGGLLALLFVGVPVAFTLATLGVTMLWFKGFPLIIAAQNLTGSLDSFILLSIPLFILMSNILLKGGVGRDLFNAFQAWVGHWPGGLATATLMASGLFSTINGSSVATAATIGTVAIPEMQQRGYKRPFTYGLVAAGGTLGILIPPSIPLIVYGVITEQSIVDLFLAGMIPGLVLLSLFAVYSFLYCHFGKAYTPMPKQGWDEKGRATLRALPTLLIAGIIIGGIYAGIFTPTEAAAIGFFCSLVLTAGFMRTLTLAKLSEAVKDTMKTSVTILLIVVGAKIFGHAITLYRIPQEVTAFVTENFHHPLSFLLAVTCVLLVIGLFLESLSMLLIMVPVLYPSLAALNIDPIWFGIYFVVLIEVALITPPVGMNLFVIQAVTKARINEVIQGALPFVFIMLGMAFLLYLFPDMALWLVRVMK